MGADIMATSLVSIELVKRSIISQGFRDHDMVSAELTVEPAGAALIHQLYAEKVAAAERRLRLCDLLQWRVRDIQAVCAGKVVDATSPLGIRMCGLSPERQANVHAIAQLLIDEMMRQEFALDIESACLKGTATWEPDGRAGVGDADA